MKFFLIREEIAVISPRLLQTTQGLLFPSNIFHMSEILDLTPDGFVLKLNELDVRLAVFLKRKRKSRMRGHAQKTSNSQQMN